MTFKLEINCDNADLEGETGDLLAKVAEQIKRGAPSGGILDSNGNHVGKFAFKGKRPE
jgi:hypothetical protein